MIDTFFSSKLYLVYATTSSICTVTKISQSCLSLCLLFDFLVHLIKLTLCHSLLLKISKYIKRHFHSTSSLFYIILSSHKSLVCPGLFVWKCFIGWLTFIIWVSPYISLILEASSYFPLHSNHISLYHFLILKSSLSLQHLLEFIVIHHVEWNKQRKTDTTCSYSFVETEKELILGRSEGTSGHQGLGMLGGSEYGERLDNKY